MDGKNTHIFFIVDYNNNNYKANIYQLVLNSSVLQTGLPRRSLLLKWTTSI